MTIQLTAREWQVMTAIARHMGQQGTSPTIREIGAAIGRGPGEGIVHTLRALHDKGVVRWQADGRCRTLTLVRGVRVGLEP